MLFKAANPDVRQLAVDAEWRRIQERFSQKQCNVEIQHIDRWAVTTDDLRRAVLDEHPVIVHFSGHGTRGQGLNFSDNGGQTHRVTGVALAGLFKHFDCVSASSSTPAIQLIRQRSSASTSIA